MRLSSASPKSNWCLSIGNSSEVSAIRFCAISGKVQLYPIPSDVLIAKSHSIRVPSRADKNLRLAHQKPCITALYGLLFDDLHLERAFVFLEYVT